MVLNKLWVKKEINMKMKEKFEASENKSIAHQNLSDTAKTVFIGKFIVKNAHFKKQKDFK